MRKTIKNNGQMLVVRETEGEFKGLVYQVMKIHKVLMIFAPKDKVTKTKGCTLCVNDNLTMTSMAWQAGDKIGILYPNTNRPFLDEERNAYCKKLAEKYEVNRFSVRPQYQLAI